MKNEKTLFFLILAIVFIINTVDAFYVFSLVESQTFLAFHIVSLSSFAVISFFVGRYAIVNIQQKELMEKKVRKFNKLLVLDDGINKTSDPVKTLEGNLQDIIQFIQEIGKGNFSVRIDKINKDNLYLNKKNLTGELIQMRAQMKKVAEEEKNRSWINQGLAKFSDLLRAHTHEFENLGDKIVRELVKYLNANQGGLFIVKEENNDKFLELAACYAYERKKYVNYKLHYKEGLLGECYLEGQTVYMTDIPQDYVHITSGLGEATPGCLVIVPLKLNDKVEGVLEIASFTPLDSCKIKFLEKLGESIASTLSNIKINENTKKLLQESQMQTEQLKMQEEKMRQSMEELNATQEELESKSRESHLQFSKLNAILDSASDSIVIMDYEGKIESCNQATAKLFKYSVEKLKNQNVQILAPEINLSEYSHKNKTNVESDKIFGQTYKTKGRKRGGNEFPVEASVNEIVFEDQKFYTAILHDITNRELYGSAQQLVSNDSHNDNGELEEEDKDLVLH